ncbi:glutamate racemase [Candidatus Falkowbacteria bacterium]|nr:glutamate racemase [Candidatus Falkowbacteria bacterium]NCT54788.1 glutamate racemase [Candidatus Falkowbacteria bacterium]
MIGVFDSGLGGLTVLKNFLKFLPEYNYLYLGDNARVPYGEKSTEVIYEYSLQAMEFLFSQGCNLIIIACNTASAQALRKLQQEYLKQNYPDRKILGVVRPLAEFAAESKKDIIGIIGTRSTVNSQAYDNEIKNLNKKIKVQAIAAPLLVPLIEEGWAKKPETKMILKKYLRPLKTNKIKLLILACTHYPFLLKDVKRICGKNILVPNPGEVVAQSLKVYLNNHPELGLKKTKNPSRNFYSSDKNGLFKKLAEKFLGKKIKEFKSANLNDF